MEINPVRPAAATATAIDPVKNQDAAQTRQLVQAVKALNQSELYGQDRELQFARDPQSHMVVIKVVQQTTGEVVDQLPPEAVLRAFNSLEQLDVKDKHE